MRFKTLLVVGVLLVATASAFPQTGAGSSDPVTGKWGADGLTYLDLKFDGTRGVTGTTVWRHGNEQAQTFPVKTGSFDVKTGALRLEGNGRTPDGMEATYVVEGTIDHDTVSGTFTFGDHKGEFSFRKLASGA